MLVDEQRPFRVDDVRGQALAEGQRAKRPGLAALHPVRKLNLLGAALEQRHVGDRHTKDVVELRPHQLHQGVELELCGQRQAEPVDGGQLRDACLYLGVQPGALDCHRGLVGQGLGQLDLARRKLACAACLLELDDRHDLAAQDERHHQ